MSPEPRHSRADWFFARSPDPLAVVDLAGRLREVNPAFEALVGRPAAQLRGCTLAELAHAEDRAALGEADTADDGVTVRMRGADGAERWVSWRIVAADASELLCAAGRDVTASHRRLQAVEMRAAQFQALVENASDMFTVVAADGSTRYTTHATEQLLGYTPEELVAIGSFGMVHPDDHDRSVGAFMELAARPGETRRHEHRLRHKDGSYRTFALSARNLLGDPAVQGMVLNSRDVTEVRAYEAALRESEGRFRTVFEQTTVSMGLSDLEGRPVLTNAAIQRFLGYTAHECTTLTHLHFTHPDDREASARLMERLVTGEVNSYAQEKRYVRKDGRVVWGRLTCSLIRDEEGRPQVVLAMIEDISDRKAAERELEESRELYRLVVDEVAQVIFRTDRQGHWTFLNRAWTDVTGYTVEESLGRRYVDFVLADDMAALLQTFQPLVTGEQPVRRHEVRYVAKNGERIWVDAQARVIRDETGTVVGTAGTLTDITQRKRAEDALRASEERFRLASQATDDVIYDWDLQTGELAWSDAIYAAFRYEPGAVAPVVDWWSERLHPDDAERVQVSLADMLESGAGHWSAEYRFRCGDGAYARVVERGSVLRDAEGTAIRMVGSMLDLTERLRLEERLRQAQKMDAVGRLAGGVAHDFNNLLTVIRAHAELLREALPQEGELADDLQEIQKASSRAAALTNQLLAFSRQQVLAPRTLGLNDTVSDVEKMLRRLIGEDIAFTTILAPDAGGIVADAGQMEQVIVNLAVNARDAMPDGGELVIETGREDLTEEDLVSRPGVRAGAFAVLQVRDTGCGMDERTRTRIFEPFFTTKEMGRGTGLGLATVYGIVEQSGGFVTVHSAPGAGASFTIRLPRVEEPEEHPAVATDADEATGTGTILVAEDEDSLRGLIERILRRQGYTVLSAPNGRAALELAAAEPREIHLVLTDAVMPLLGGPELVRQLSPLRPAMRVLYMTGYTDSQLLRRGVEDASAELLQKPFSTKQLLRAVREAMESRPAESCALAARG